MDCADRPSLMDGAEGLMCGELVERLANEVPAIGSRCEGTAVPINPACAEYAEVASACLTEQCPNAATLGPGTENLFANLCSAALANGDFEVSQLAGIANSGCNNLLVSSVIGYFLAVDGPEGSGGLLPLCQDGPLNAAETCDVACNKLNECIPEGTPEDEGGGLRDYPACRLLCGASDAIAPETWTCVSGQDSCGDVFACFQEPRPEPIDACIGFAAVVDGCIAQSCPEKWGHLGGHSYRCDKSVQRRCPERDIYRGGGNGLSRYQRLRRRPHAALHRLYVERESDGDGFRPTCWAVCRESHKRLRDLSAGLLCSAGMRTGRQSAQGGWHLRILLHDK